MLHPDEAYVHANPNQSRARGRLSTPQNCLVTSTFENASPEARNVYSATEDVPEIVLRDSGADWKRVSLDSLPRDRRRLPSPPGLTGAGGLLAAAAAARPNSARPKSPPNCIAKRLSKRLQSPDSIWARVPPLPHPRHKQTGHPGHGWSRGQPRARSPAQNVTLDLSRGQHLLKGGWQRRPDAAPAVRRH